MTRILSVSYDVALLNSRQLLLESLGCRVISASDFEQTMQHCSLPGGSFDLLVLGHSIPQLEKNAIITAFRSHSSAPVIALKKVGEEPTSAADWEIEPEPAHLLQVISRVISGHAASA